MIVIPSRFDSSVGRPNRPPRGAMARSNGLHRSAQPAPRGARLALRAAGRARNHRARGRGGRCGPRARWAGGLRPFHGSRRSRPGADHGQPAALRPGCGRCAGRARLTAYGSGLPGFRLLRGLRVAAHRVSSPARSEDQDRLCSTSADRSPLAADSAGHHSFRVTVRIPQSQPRVGVGGSGGLSPPPFTRFVRHSPLSRAGRRTRCLSFGAGRRSAASRR